MKRRDFVTAAGAGAIAALAGCSSAVGAVAPPNVPSDRLESGGWELQAEQQGTVFESTFGPVTVTADAHTLQYADAALRAELAEKTLGRIDDQVAMFVASRIVFSPNLTGLPGVQGAVIDQTETASRSQFETQMEAAGLTNVEQVETGTLSIETGETARLTRYDAEFPFDGVAFPVTDDRSVTIEGDPLTVTGELAVWAHGDSVLVAGGAAPAENFARSVTEDLSSAISVTVDVDLGLEPETYREERRSLIAGVS